MNFSPKYVRNTRLTLGLREHTAKQKIVANYTHIFNITKQKNQSLNNIYTKIGEKKAPDLATKLSTPIAADLQCSIPICNQST